MVGKTSDGLVGLCLAKRIVEAGFEGAGWSMALLPTSAIALAVSGGSNGSATDGDGEAGDPVVVTPAGGRHRVVAGADRALKAVLEGATSLNCLVVLPRAVVGQTPSSPAHASTPTAPAKGAKTVRLPPAPAPRNRTIEAKGGPVGRSLPEAIAAALAVAVSGEPDPADVSAVAAVVAGRPDWLARGEALTKAIEGIDVLAARAAAGGEPDFDSALAEILAEGIETALGPVRTAEPRSTTPKKGAVETVPRKRRDHEPSEATLRLVTAANLSLVVGSPHGVTSPRGQTTAVEALNKMVRMDPAHAVALVRGLARNASGRHGNVTTNLLGAGRKVLADPGLPARVSRDVESAIASLDLEAVRSRAREILVEGKCRYDVGALSMAMAEALDVGADRIAA